MARRRDDDDDDDDRPRRKRRDDDDDDDRPRRRRREPEGGSGMGLVIALGGGAVLLLFAGIGAAAYFMLRSDKKAEPEPEVAQQQPAGVVQPGLQLPNRGNVVPPGGKPKPPPVQPAPKPVPGVVPVPSVGPSTQRLVFGGTEDGYAAAVSFRTDGVGDRVDVVKTATGEAKGRVDVNGLSDNLALSPDGKWLAAVGSAVGQGRPVTLYSVSANSQAVKTFTPYPRGGNRGFLLPDLVWVVFVGPDKLLTINEHGGFDVWSVPALQRQAGIPARKGAGGAPIATNGFTHSPTNFALTPDGKTLVLFNGTGFSVYDAATAAETARTEAIMQENGAANFWGMAFRADGSRFVCNLTMHTPTRTDALLVWDAKTGKRLSLVQQRTPKHGAGVAWWGADYLLLGQGGVGGAEVISVATGEHVGNVMFEHLSNSKVATVTPSDKLWGITGGSLFTPGGGAAVLVSADPPAAARPNATFSITSQGLKVK